MCELNLSTGSSKWWWLLLLLLRHTCLETHLLLLTTHTTHSSHSPYSTKVLISTHWRLLLLHCIKTAKTLVLIWHTILLLFLLLELVDHVLFILLVLNVLFHDLLQHCHRIATWAHIWDNLSWTWFLKQCHFAIRVYRSSWYIAGNIETTIKKVGRWRVVSLRRLNWLWGWLTKITKKINWLWLRVLLI